LDAAPKVDSIRAERYTKEHFRSALVALLIIAVGVT
jgi:hypothetical protein